MNDDVLYHVRRAKARFSSRCKSRSATFVPAGRWYEKVDPPITDGVKLPVINALYGAITVNKEIDLEEA